MVDEAGSTICGGASAVSSPGPVDAVYDEHRKVWNGSMDEPRSSPGPTNRLSPKRIDALSGAARRSTTWQPTN